MVGEELINTQPIADSVVYIADKLGYTVEQIYTVYTHAYTTIALVNMIALIVVSIITTIAFILIYRYLRKSNDIDDSAFGAGLWAGLVCTITIFAAIVIRDTLIMYLCPEYTAINAILYQIGGMIH
jgi:hypothetical protein